MPSAPDRFYDLVRAERPDAGEVAAFLDGLDHASRLSAVRSLDGAVLQERVWTLAVGAPAVTLDDLVAPDRSPLDEVIWYGKNSLPVFTVFEKRFCRPSPAWPGEHLWGYNAQPLGWLTGPGYFVCHREDDVPAVIDYRRVPPEHPPTWPLVTPNDRGLSRFVYRDMVDLLRRVSRHVLIGRATRHGAALPNYFLLCREP